MARLRKERLTSSRLGMVTLSYVVSSLFLGLFVPRISEKAVPWLVSPLSQSTISTILSAIASGMITLTGIVFSLVFVIVQFGSSAYSPRITKMFINMGVLRHSLGIFTATFLYSLMALRTIGLRNSDTVSEFVVWLAVLWLLASIVVLGKLVQVFTGLTIGNVLFALSDAGCDSIARVYPSAFQEKTRSENSAVAERESLAELTRKVVYRGDPSYVIGYNRSLLVAYAQATNTVIHLPYSIGEALQNGEPIALIVGEHPSIRDEPIYDAIELSRERAFPNDPKYALRLLVDMAIRALSPGINDPTTATQALEHIEMLLGLFGKADLDVGHVKDGQGIVRVIYSTPRWEDFMRLGLSEIMQYGATSLQVQRRLEALLQFLKRSVPEARVPVVEKFEEYRRSIAAQSFGSFPFPEWANEPDRSGVGRGRGV